MDSPHKRPVIWTLCLLTCLPGEAAEQSVELPMIRDAIVPMWHQCNGFGKSNDCIQKTICRKCFQGFSSLYALWPQACQVCASCGNKSLVLRELPHVFPVLWQGCVWYIMNIMMFSGKYFIYPANNLIQISRSHGRKIDDLNPIWVRLLGRSQLTNPSDLPCLMIDRSNKSKRNRPRRKMFLPLLWYFTIIWCEYLMVLNMFHGSL